MKNIELWDPYADFQNNVLPNGLNVYHNLWKRPWIKVGFVVHSGSFSDTINRSGIAHFVEHMLSKNIKGISRKDAVAFFKKFGGNAMFGATSLLATKYWFSIPAEIEILKKSLEIFGNMMLECSFEKYLERERKVILCEFGENFPININYEVYKVLKHEMLYHGLIMQNYRGNLGNEKSIAEISRDDLFQYYVSNYVPKNISVVVVGDIGKDEFLRVLSDSVFSKDIVGERNPLPEVCQVLPKPQELKHELSISDYFAGISTISAPYHSFIAIPENYEDGVLKLFEDMMDDILDNEIRQKLGASYNVDVKRDYNGQARELCIGGMMNPSVIDRMDDLVQSCLGKIKKNRKLFNMLKTSGINRHKMLDINGRRLMEVAMDDLKDFQRIISIKEEISKLEAVSFKDVCDLSDYVSDVSRRWTVIWRP